MKAHEDLLWTFPALAIVGHAVAFDALGDAARHSYLARTLGVPMWLRKLPPEALPRLAGAAQPMAKTAPSATRRQRFLPRSIEGGSVCCHLCSLRAACGDDFAVWWAQAKNSVECIEAAAAMGAYAYSPTTLAAPLHLIRRRWTPRAPAMAMAMAREAHDWLVRLLLDATRPWRRDLRLSRRRLGPSNSAPARRSPRRAR